MKVSMISFTKNGVCLSQQIINRMENWEMKAYTKCSAYFAEAESLTEISFVNESLSEWTRAQMEEKQALIFIGACGIAVRAIAPFIVDKLRDNPVLVVDEQGRYVIPILSGHMGGANELAHSLAEKLQAEPIITTATDLNHKFAVDLFAKQNCLEIENKDGIAKVSSKILDSKAITMSIEQGHISKSSVPAYIHLVPYPPTRPLDVLITEKKEEFEAKLYLRPKEYCIGIGCKKDKEPSEIAALIERTLAARHIKKAHIFALASIDRKAKEAGLLAWAREQSVPFLTFSADMLQEIEGEFSDSAFVENTVGVGNVCERAALAACGTRGQLIMKKQAENGMTIALAKRDWSVNFDGF